MRVSGFTFLRNAEMLGYPFRESILSVLPIVDEFIVALGPSKDNTEAILNSIKDPKVKIIHTQWNENMRTDVRVKGFVYGQQKSIALFNCTGDWAFYLEGDEVVHEDDLQKIRSAMERYLDDKDVEALIFDYIHFYGNKDTYAWSPAWYRTAPRILRNNIPAWAPKGLFFIVLEDHKKGRYPRAAHSGARIYHYGWVRAEEEMNEKSRQVQGFWGKGYSPITYEDIDPKVLSRFSGTHPAVMRDWLKRAERPLKPNPNYRLTTRDKRQRLKMIVEKLFGIDLSKKHYRLIKR